MKGKLHEEGLEQDPLNIAFATYFHLYLYFHMYLYLYLCLWNLHLLNDEIEVVPASVGKETRVERKSNQSGVLRFK